MCGIVGCAGAISANDEKIFRQLLVFDTVRGEDSTGIASVNPDGDVLVAKCVGTPFDLLPRKTASNIFSRANRVLIGHNRYATQGAVNNSNAHPFEFDKVVGVHNGTLKSRYQLKFNNYAVDSEQLYANIDEDGIRTVIPKVDGAYALVYYNIEDETLHFIRNSERPLFYAFTEDEKRVFWASEAWMLSAALGREGVKHKGVFSVEVDTLYTFNVGIGKVNNAMPVLTYNKEELKQEKKSQTTTHSFTYPGWISERDYKKEEGSVIGKWVAGKINASIVYETQSGSKYVQGYDKLLKIHFRIYSNDAAYLSTLLNKEVEGRVIGCLQSAQIYVLAIKTVRTQEEILSEALKEAEDEGVEVVVYDHANKKVSLAAFNQRYSQCSNCSSDIAYGDVYKPIDHNTCLCADCFHIKA